MIDDKSLVDLKNYKEYLVNNLSEIRKLNAGSSLMIKEYDVRDNINYIDNVLYLCEKIKGKSKFKIGKYIEVCIELIDINPRCDIYMNDEKIHTDLYDHVFGSHSYINEFFEDKVIPLLDIFLGKFEQYNFTDIIKFFENYGKEYDYLNKKYVVITTTSKIEAYKKCLYSILYTLDNISRNEKLQSIIDDFIENFYKSLIECYKNNN